LGKRKKGKMGKKREFLQVLEKKSSNRGKKSRCPRTKAFFFDLLKLGVGGGLKDTGEILPTSEHWEGRGGRRSLSIKNVDTAGACVKLDWAPVGGKKGLKIRALILQSRKKEKGEWVLTQPTHGKRRHLSFKGIGGERVCRLRGGKCHDNQGERGNVSLGPISESFSQRS